MPHPWNRDGADWIDLGLGGFLKAAGYPAEVYEPELGKFRTSSLRNADLSPGPEFVKSYSHNGFFKSLGGMYGIVHFYARRGMMDGNFMPGNMDGPPMMDLFPAPELGMNRELTMPHFSMMDRMRVEAFLRTLSDGFFTCQAEARPAGMSLDIGGPAITREREAYLPAVRTLQ